MHFQAASAQAEDEDIDNKGFEKWGRKKTSLLPFIASHLDKAISWNGKR